MNIQKTISIVLLIAMSFSSLHAYAITLLDEDHCSVSEYVQEIQQASLSESSGDVCDVHHEFHVLYLLPETSACVDDVSSIDTEISASETYTFYLQDNVLQPPISLS